MLTSDKTQWEYIIIIYVQGQSLLQKSNDVNRIVNVSRTTTNVTLLNPFSTYSIQVIAVTIRTHDFKVLTGRNSKANYFITVEDGNVTCCVW